MLIKPERRAVDAGTTGQFQAPALECAGVLTAVGPVGARELHLHQVTTPASHEHCAPEADITLIVNATGDLQMLWQETGFPNNTATATLFRDQPHIGS